MVSELQQITPLAEMCFLDVSNQVQSPPNLLVKVFNVFFLPLYIRSRRYEEEDLLHYIRIHNNATNYVH